MATVFPRRVPGAALTLLLTAFALAAAALVATAGAAHAADGYRYWNYSHLQHGDWSFATTGAGQYVPKDGAVEGYRFGTSTVKQGLPPRTDPKQVSFHTVCGGEKAGPSQKRVAVVLDFGTPAEADGATVPHPRAACAVVPQKASGLQALESVADVRAPKGMVCGIDGYPASGCGDAVKNATVPAHEQAVTFSLPSSGQTAQPSTRPVSQRTEDGGTPWTLVGVAAAVVVIAGGALALSRRNRSV